MHWQRNNSSSTTKNQDNTVSQEENNSSLETKLKTSEDCDLTDWIQIAIMDKTQLTTRILRKATQWVKSKINKQKEYFTKEIETLKKNQWKFWSWITQ